MTYSVPKITSSVSTQTKSVVLISREAVRRRCRGRHFHPQSSKSYAKPQLRAGNSDEINQGSLKRIVCVGVCKASYTCGVMTQFGGLLKYASSSHPVLSC